MQKWYLLRLLGGGWKRAAEGVNSSMIYLIHCKNLCKCYNVSPPSTAIIKKKILKDQ
jgi:hypothetical protein